MSKLFTKQWWLFMTLYKKPFENIVGKGQNASYKHYLLFLQSFLPFLWKISTFEFH